MSTAVSITTFERPAVEMRATESSGTPYLDLDFGCVTIRVFAGEHSGYERIDLERIAAAFTGKPEGTALAALSDSLQREEPIL